jgi:predicted RNase H-like nuclease (RuvC/YqgF family)
VTLSNAYSSKSKAELVEEIVRLNKELREKSEQIEMLKKRLLIYKAIK